MSIYDPTIDFIEDLRNWMRDNPLTDDDLKSIQPVPGIPHTQEFKDNIRKRMMGNKHTLGLKCKPEHVLMRSISRSRPIMIDNMIFSSGKDAAKHFGVSPAQIVKWQKKGRAIKMVKKSDR